MVIATTTDFHTDEDSHQASRVTRMMIDSFLRKPSIDDRAMHGIVDFVNEGLCAELKKNKDENAPEELCAFATVFMVKGQCRWITGGGSMVFHFEDGKLARHSQSAETPPLGAMPKYPLTLDPAFVLTANDNAFLVCSKEMAKQTTPEMLERTLQASKSPEEWMHKIIDEIGEARQFCGNAVFLPRRTRLGKAAMR